MFEARPLASCRRMWIEAGAAHPVALQADDLDRLGQLDQAVLGHVGAQRTAGRAGRGVFRDAGGVAGKHARIDAARSAIGIRGKDEDAQPFARKCARYGRQVGHGSIDDRRAAQWDEQERECRSSPSGSAYRAASRTRRGRARQPAPHGWAHLRRTQHHDASSRPSSAPTARPRFAPARARCLLPDWPSVQAGGRGWPAPTPYRPSDARRTAARGRG